MFRTGRRAAIMFALAAMACETTQSKPAPLPQEPAAAPASSTAGPNVDAATSAAQSWLVLVDEEKYGESWTSAATLFKSAQFATTLPGAPDGKYVVIQFNTTFANKAAAVETITPMQEPDGTWKVSGYFIK